MGGFMTEQPPKKACGRSFNYCLFSKIIVAIPALPITAYLASMPFDNGIVKLVASFTAIALLIFAAIKVDQIPALQKKIVNKNH